MRAVQHSGAKPDDAPGDDGIARRAGAARGRLLPSGSRAAASQHPVFRACPFSAARLRLMDVCRHPLRAPRACDRGSNSRHCPVGARATSRARGGCCGDAPFRPGSRMRESIFDRRLFFAGTDERRRTRSSAFADPRRRRPAARGGGGASRLLRRPLDAMAERPRVSRAFPTSPYRTRHLEAALGQLLVRWWPGTWRGTRHRRIRRALFRRLPSRASREPAFSRRHRVPASGAGEGARRRLPEPLIGWWAPSPPTSTERSLSGTKRVAQPCRAILTHLYSQALPGCRRIRAGRFPGLRAQAGHDDDLAGSAGGFLRGLHGARGPGIPHRAHGAPPFDHAARNRRATRCRERRARIAGAGVRLGSVRVVAYSSSPSFHL